MDVTTTPHISKLVKSLQKDHPSIQFTLGDTCKWNYASQEVMYHASGTALQLLHELGHALLHHESFTSDIELMQLEVAAWNYAVTHLAPHYGVTVQHEAIDEDIHTYSLWLHQRSLCPACQQTGVQHTKNTYKCLNCRCSWRVNDARMCALRRAIL